MMDSAASFRNVAAEFVLHTYLVCKIEMRFFFGASHYQSRTTVANPFCKNRKLLFGLALRLLFLLLSFLLQIFFVYNSYYFLACFRDSVVTSLSDINLCCLDRRVS